MKTIDERTADIKVGDLYDNFGQVWEIMKVRTRRPRGAPSHVYEVNARHLIGEGMYGAQYDWKTFHVSALESMRKVSRDRGRSRRDPEALKLSEVRTAVLQALNQLSLYELRRPGSSQLYNAHQILTGIIIPFRVPKDVLAYLRDANPLALASIEAAIDKNIHEREVEQRRPLSSRRSRRR